jgi:hypothetical protein
LVLLVLVDSASFRKSRAHCSHIADGFVCLNIVVVVVVVSIIIATGAAVTRHIVCSAEQLVFVSSEIKHTRHCKSTVSKTTTTPTDQTLTLCHAVFTKSQHQKR